MKERVEQVRQQRETAARGRDRRLWPTVGIVGYTNAGKSTLLNALVGSEVALRRGQAVRDARPDQPPGQARRRPDRDRDRHRRVHPQAAAPAGRRVPGDARGGQPGRRPDRGRRRVRRATSTEHRATVQTVLDELGAGRQAAPRRVQQGRPARPGRARRRRRRRRRSPGAVFVSALTGYGLDTLRAEIAGAAGVAVGRRRRRAAVRGRRAAGAGPRARHGRARVRRARRARHGPRRAVAGRRARRRGRALGGATLDDDGRGRGGRPRRAMTAPTPARRLGGPLADGAIVTWTVAEGRRGPALARGRGPRRRRPSTRCCSRPTPDGRFSHLELARADGLWTLHPEADGTLHGNHVDRASAGSGTSTAWPFGPDDAARRRGLAVSRGGGRLASRPSVGRGGRGDVGPASSSRPTARSSASASIARRAARPTAPGGSGRGSRSRSTTTGLPVLADGQTRPLELG